MRVCLVGSSFGWNDSGNLSVAQPAGIQVGDMVMALLANQANSDVGAGFSEKAGMPAVNNLFLHSYPRPGVGGTLQWKYWTAAATDPDPYTWSCVAILDMGTVVVFRTDGGSITPDAHTTKDNANTTTHPTNSLTPAASTFAVGCWSTASGGLTVDWTGDSSMTTLQNNADPGTLRQTMIVQASASPVGAFTKTATLSQAQDACAYMTTWTGNPVGPQITPCPFAPLGQIIRYR